MSDMVVNIPAVGTVGPNFIVSEANGYRSREQIVLKQAAAGTPAYPDGLVLKLEEVEVSGGDPGETEPGVAYVPFDGSGDAAGILYQTTDATKANARAVAIVRDAEVQRAMLKFSGTLTDPQKDAAYASLAAHGVVMR